MDDETRLVPIQDPHAPAAAETVAVTELTTKVAAALDMLAALIPDLRTPHPATARKVRAGRTVSRQTVTSTVAMVEQFPALLQHRHTMNLERAREVLGSADAYRLLGERLEILAARVNYTAEARWAEVAGDAMRTIRHASILAERPLNPEEEQLGVHLTKIRGHLGRRNAATGKRKKKN